MGFSCGARLSVFLYTRQEGKKGGEEDVRLEVKQGAHPDPLERFTCTRHMGYVAHKGVVSPAHVHIH